ncbi:circadian clock protein KaiB [Leptolyngbya sp. FACHB-36]|uniref:circadian clock KaiB family protein n=1 Tax=Leptolyngbya sp. FACHB-36 TaxID=2692808 RepID=UPI00168154E3|nr:circadian clock KaiB family protein [Leptolyngbya sp. FACHB-36]MBD2021101.1 circadian clock protein KaiB [Leptolyngbya sp. FACHB-36]
MKPNSSPPVLFKGIALFTPGGDLVYCIDPNKQTRWHLHLCAALQELLGLPEPPHFLVPCYTATVDRWRDSHTQVIQTAAEAAPTVLRYQPLLNVIFETENLMWQPALVPEGVCDAIVLATYRQQFPQLWEAHDLVVRYEQAVSYTHTGLDVVAESVDAPITDQSEGYVLRLFVSGHSLATERTLQTLHQFLDQALGQPYTLKVIDVLQHPEQAERDQISATPTLVRVHPRPMRRIVGTLHTLDQLQRLLGLPES